MTITVNGQTIETDDAKEIQAAISAARKAEAAERKARQKAEKEREANRAIAENAAYRSAYLVYQRKARDFSGYTRYCPPGAKWSPARECESYPALKLSVEGSGGSATVTFYGQSYAGCIADGGGIALAIFVSDRETHEVSAFAVGTHGGELRTLDLPGVSIADFPDITKTPD